MIYINKVAYNNNGVVKISQANLKMIILDKYEISIAFDDSCGAFPSLSRVDARVFELGTNNDITYDLVEDSDIRIHGFEDIQSAVEMIKRYDNNLK